VDKRTSGCEMTGVRGGGVNSLLQVITTLAETTHYTDSGPSESVSKTEIRRMILHLGAKNHKHNGAGAVHE